MKPYLTCYRGVAHTWLCDHNNHLNTRHYVGMFDDAMQHFFNMLGYESEENFGWADVHHSISYKAEVKPGSLVHVDCALIKLGGKSIKYRQNLILTNTEEIAASNDATTVLFDQVARKAVGVPEIIRENALSFTLSDSDLT